MAPAPKSEFRNDFAGQIGVVVRNDAGTGYRGISVKPGHHIWLDEDEQVATANAPRRDEDNPFTNGSLTLVTEATRIRNRRPIGFTEEGQPPQPEPAAEAPAPEEPQETQEDPEKAKREAEARKVQEERKAAEESARAASQRQHDKPAAEAAKKTAATAKKAAATEEVGTPAAAG